MMTKRMNTTVAVVSLFLLAFSQPGFSEQSKSPLITESYYRVKWGYFDEFMDLFKKNHYPILREMKALGHIESIVVDYPLNHASEDHRWDVRVTITIPNTEKYKKDMGRVSKKLYPDQDALKKAETKRFRMLLAHQDIMLRRDDTSSW